MAGVELDARNRTGTIRLCEGADPPRDSLASTPGVGRLRLPPLRSLGPCRSAAARNPAHSVARVSMSPVRTYQPVIAALAAIRRVGPRPRLLTRSDLRELALACCATSSSPPPSRSDGDLGSSHTSKPVVSALLSGVFPDCASDEGLGRSILWHSRNLCQPSLNRAYDFELPSQRQLTA